MGWQAESSTPRDQVHEQQQLSDMDTTFMEQLQGYDSFSLPPGLYPPAAAAGSPLGMQTPDQGTQISAGQLQTQGSHLSGGESYPLYYSAADQASSVQRPQCLSADAHYFQTAQMKLRAREERLQVERALQLTLMQQQQQAQAVQMQLQLQQQQQQQQLWQQPAPPPRVTVCEAQVTASCLYSHMYDSCRSCAFLLCKSTLEVAGHQNLQFAATMIVSVSLAAA